MDYGEAALAAYPLATLGKNAGIVEDGSFVEQDAPAVDRACEWYLVGVEIVEAGLPLDFVW